MTTPTIEPAPTSATPLTPGPGTYVHPPYVPPYPGPRVPWYARHPGAAATLAVGIAVGMAHLTGMGWDMFADKERAERQRLIDEGDRAEATERRESDEAMGLAISANGRAIQALSDHQIEAAKLTHRLLRSLGPAGSAVGVANELDLRQATSKIRALRGHQDPL